LRFAKAAWMAAVLLSAAGCADQHPRIELPAQVLMLDAGLAAKVRMEQHLADRIEGNLLRVRTRFRNASRDSVWVDIQVSWKDQNAFELYKTNWAPFHLPAGLVTEHEIVSLNADAADYEFRIRRQGSNR